MLKYTMTCDGCGMDLTDSGSMPGFYLTLTSAMMPSTSESRFAMHVTPSIVEPMHFCGLGCLRKKFNT
jgi:hypothetical protein